MTVLLLNHEILEKGNSNELFLKPKYDQTYLFKEFETGVSKNLICIKFRIFEKITKLEKTIYHLL